jgi:hypothetical protein
LHSSTASTDEWMSGPRGPDGEKRVSRVVPQIIFPSSVGQQPGLTYPHVEVEVFICYRLNIESNGRYRRHNLANLDVEEVSNYVVQLFCCSVPYMPLIDIVALFSPHCPTAECSDQRSVYPLNKRRAIVLINVRDLESRSGSPFWTRTRIIAVTSTRP